MSESGTHTASIVIPLPSDEHLGAEMATEVNEHGQNLNDIRMVAGTGELALPIGTLAAAIFRVSGVDPKIRQFIVLRIAKLLACPNLLGPNERMAENLGATPIEVEGLQSSGFATGLDDDARLVVQATDELTTTGTLADETLSALRNRYDDDVCRKYIMVICYYNMFARFFNGTRIPGESEADIDQKVGVRPMPV